MTVLVEIFDLRLEFGFPLRKGSPMFALQKSASGTPDFLEYPGRPPIDQDLAGQVVEGSRSEITIAEPPLRVDESVLVHEEKPGLPLVHRGRHFPAQVLVVMAGHAARGLVASDLQDMAVQRIERTNVEFLAGRFQIATVLRPNSLEVRPGRVCFRFGDVQGWVGHGVHPLFAADGAAQ